MNREALSDRLVVWFRRDLRVVDHAGLGEAVRLGAGTAALFVLDPALLHGRFASSNRAWFMLESVRALREALRALGGDLFVVVGSPVVAVPAFAREVGASSVVVSRDYAPYGRRRDRAVADALARHGITFHAKRALLVHEPEEVHTGSGTPFSVFTPFLRRWEGLPLRTVLPAPTTLRPIEDAVRRVDPGVIPGIAALGVPPPTGDVRLMREPGEAAARARLEAWLSAGPDAGVVAYSKGRDRLGDEAATSRLSADLRFGLVSPVEVATRALAVDAGGAGSRRFVSELAWRDFYAHALWHDPRLAREPYQRRYRGLVWPGGSLPSATGLGEPAAATAARARSSAADHVDAWRTGRTGYPVVDAAMRQLLATGFIPNRARMISASFLTKDLLVDWRVGEAHFMAHLLDGDPASNLGGWQWAASVGTDAQPYFRVFNPVTQAERFDPDGRYVRRWIPELARVPTARVHAPWTMTVDEQAAAGCRIGVDYPAPIVDHAHARARAIEFFAAQSGLGRR